MNGQLAEGTKNQMVSLSHEESAWTHINPAQYEKALFEETAQIKQLMDDQVRVAKRAALAPSMLVEVGSGCGTFLVRVAAHFSGSLGVDISSQAVDYLNQRIKTLELGSARALSVLCDATEELHTLVSSLSKSDGIPNPRTMVLAAMTNTLGIMPNAKRVACVRQMLATVSDPLISVPSSSCCVFTFFNAAEFRGAVDWFYRRHQNALCGPFEDVLVDYEQCTLNNPRTGYSTKWWTAVEAVELLQAAGAKPDQIQVEYAGVALLITVWASPRALSQQHQSDPRDGADNEAILIL